MLSYEVCELLSYWHMLGGGNRVPEREQLDLRQLKSILPWMFILEMTEDGALRYRLVGSAIEEAIGRGMTGQIHSEIFANTEQAILMEETHAVSLVQGSGLLRIGKFNLMSDRDYRLEVLALPFQDTRAMGGTILVGVVAPFECQNQSFIDRWGYLDEKLSILITVPSPRRVSHGHLSKKTQALLREHGLNLKVLDTQKVLDMDSNDLLYRDFDIPTVEVDERERPHLNS